MALDRPRAVTGSPRRPPPDAEMDDHFVNLKPKRPNIFKRLIYIRMYIYIYLFIYWVGLIVGGYILSFGDRKKTGREMSLESVSRASFG